MSTTTILRQATRLAILLTCSFTLSSCSTIGGLLEYIISLPEALISAIVP